MTDWGEKVEHLILPHILGNESSCFLLERAHIFPSLLFTTNVHIEAFSVAFDVPLQIQFCQGFSLLKLIPRWLGLLLCILLKLPDLASIICRSPFCAWVCPGAPCSFMQAFWCFCLTSSLLVCIWMEESLNIIQLSCPHLPSSALFHGALPSRSLKRPKSAFLKSQRPPL